LDISRPLLAMATTRAGAAGLENVRFERGDAQVHVFPSAGFDAVVSRFGVMFFDDPHAAFANFARSLRSGGSSSRVCRSCWPMSG
jgi:ubiquinone/menaquinone biosynthesis C-methylase UbiE